MKETICVSCVDWIKLFFAYCVIALHTSFLSEIGNGIVFEGLSVYIFKFAVPFFFVCSGFFLGKKLYAVTQRSDRQIILRKYFKRLAVPYLFWGILYFVIQIGIDVMHNGGTIISAFLRYGHQWLTSSPGGGLWYVQTILILILIIMILDTSKKFDIFCIVLFAAYLIGEAFDCISAGGGTSYLVKIVEAYESVFVSRRNFFFYGLFFTGGIQLARFYDTIKIKKKTAFLALLFCYLMYVIINILGGYFLAFSGVCVIGIIACLFYLSNETCYEATKETSYFIRKISTVIYFTHYFAIYAFRTLITLMDKQAGDFYSLTWTVCSVILTVYAVVLLKLDKNKKIINSIY